MGSRSNTGGRLPVSTRSGAGHEASAEAPGGPPPERATDLDPRDTSHVTLKVAELQRLIHPKASPSEP
jgi:hypothetical protein